MTVGVRVVVIVIHVLGWFSVVTPNGTVASTAFGWVDVNKSARATPANVVPAGSLAKPFTAALVMQQVEQGRMALDDNLAPYVDQYLATWRRHKSGPATTLVSLYGPRMANVTLRDCLSMRAVRGLTSGVDVETYLGRFNPALPVPHLNPARPALHLNPALPCPG